MSKATTLPSVIVTHISVLLSAEVIFKEHRKRRHSVHCVSKAGVGAPKEFRVIRGFLSNFAKLVVR